MTNTGIRRDKLNQSSSGSASVRSLHRPIAALSLEVHHANRVLDRAGMRGCPNFFCLGCRMLKQNQTFSAAGNGERPNSSHVKLNSDVVIRRDRIHRASELQTVPVRMVDPHVDVRNALHSRSPSQAMRKATFWTFLLLMPIYITPLKQHKL